jgi:hypothetical protein
MICKFCESEFPYEKGEFYCPGCNSLHKFLEENDKRILIWAYPHKSLRINFQKQIIYIIKE